MIKGTYILVQHPSQKGNVIRHVKSNNNSNLKSLFHQHHKLANNSKDNWWECFAGAVGKGLMMKCLQRETTNQYFVKMYIITVLSKLRTYWCLIQQTNNLYKLKSKLYCQNNVVIDA